MKFPLLIIAFILSYTTTINSQKINQEVHIENQQPFLLGKITPEALSANTYKTWYLPNFSNYKADTEKIKLIKSRRKNEKSNYQINFNCSCLYVWY